MNPQNEQTFAQVFASLLKSRGMSQRQAAIKLNVAESQVSRWLRGQGGISLENIERISATFGVDRALLLALVGYRDNTGATVEAPVDAEINALLDAERAEAHLDLKDIPPTFWPAVLEASRAARRLVAEMARQNRPSSLISTPQSEPINPPAQSPADLSKGAARRRRRGLTIDLGLSAA